MKTLDIKSICLVIFLSSINNSESFAIEERVLLINTRFKHFIIKESSTIKDPIIYLILNEMKGQDWVTH
jgi:hypothetical protein